MLCHVGHGDQAMAKIKHLCTFHDVERAVFQL